MVGWLRGLFMSVCVLVLPDCGFSLSLFCTPTSTKFGILVVLAASAATVTAWTGATAEAKHSIKPSKY